MPANDKQKITVNIKYIQKMINLFIEIAMKNVRGKSNLPIDQAFGKEARVVQSTENSLERIEQKFEELKQKVS